jgi:hypothetical protein
LGSEIYSRIKRFRENINISFLDLTEASSASICLNLMLKGWPCILSSVQSVTRITYSPCCQLWHVACIEWVGDNFTATINFINNPISMISWLLDKLQSVMQSNLIRWTRQPPLDSSQLEAKSMSAYGMMDTTGHF